jgi:hypothetical protein
MKQLALALSIFSACCRLAFAGTAYTDKEMKQVAPAPCPQWYSDNEWNVSLWGTYAATGTEYAPNPSLADIVQSTTEGHTVYGTFESTSEATTPGAVASISNIFSIVTSALASKDLS